MYRILVVDDEPIILSGIRFLLDWQKYDCEIIATERNGLDAYEVIRNEHPDIVITDIKMPVMDGLELLEKCSSEFPYVVFLILTSLEEFKLAKEAIRYNARDYLLKTELDPQILSSALVRAKAECDRRHSLMRNITFENFKKDELSSIIANLMVMRDISNEVQLLLFKNGLLDSYAFLGVFFEYPVSNLEKIWTVSDYDRLFGWEWEVVDKIMLPACRSVFHVSPVSGKKSMYLFFMSGMDPTSWPAVVQRLDSRVSKASGLVTGLKTTVRTSGHYSGKENLKQARHELELACAGYYLGKEPDSLETLELDGLFPKIERDIKNGDIPSLKADFKTIRDTVGGVEHGISQISFLLSALKSATDSAIAAIGVPDRDRFEDIFSVIPYLSRRTLVLTFLDDVQRELEQTLSSMNGDGRNQIIDKARSYVLENVCRRISLSDVASHACVSSGYLSQYFKKITGISLVDYINQMKVVKAKELMASGMDKINEIATALGYDNIYYFSKVFKKVSGMTPSGYMRKLSGKTEPSYRDA